MQQKIGIAKGALEHATRIESMEGHPSNTKVATTTSTLKLSQVNT